MVTIKQSEVVTFVCDKVIEVFSEATDVPSALDIQRAISKIAENTEVSLGKKQIKEKRFNEETGKFEYIERDVEDKKPLTSYYTKMSLNEIKACQVEILKNISQIKYPSIENYDKSNFIKGLKELKKCAWMIKADQIPRFVTELMEAVLYSEGMQSDDYKYQKIIYLKSEIEGGGKSTLLGKIREGAEKFDLRTSESNWPLGRFSDLTPYAKCNICTIDDTSYETLRNINVDKLKLVGRRSPVECEKKGLNGVNITPRAAIFAAGNIEPPVAGDRIWENTTFDCISYKADQLKKLNEVKASEAMCADLSYLFNSFSSFDIFAQAVRKIESIEDINKNDLIKNENKNLSRVYGLPFLKKILEDVQDCVIDFNRCSINDLIKNYNCLGKEVTGAQRNLLLKTVKQLYSMSFISKKNCASDDYIKWDLNPVMDLDIEAIFTTSEGAETVEDELKENEEMWDKIISLFENDDDWRGVIKEENMVKDEELEARVNTILKAEEEKVKEEKDFEKMEESASTFNVKSHIKEDHRGKRLVLTFERLSDRQKFWKTYWIYNEDGGYDIRNSNAFSSDLKQIWQSKGRYLETDEDWLRFSKRAMSIIDNSKPLYITSSCHLDIDPTSNKILKVYAGEITDNE